MDYNKNNGFTLLELLITLSIFSILSFASLYYYQNHNNKTKLNLYINQFFVDLTYAKEQALIKQNQVSICPIHHNWDKGYEITWQETKYNKKKNSLLTRTPPYPNTLHIQSHFGLHQPCVYFDAQGQSLFNGHFIYTLEKSEAYGKVILTQTGKMHLEIS